MTKNADKAYQRLTKTWSRGFSHHENEASACAQKNGGKSGEIENLIRKLEDLYEQKKSKSATNLENLRETGTNEETEKE